MLRGMQQEVDWILDALARDPAKTRTGLAKALNIDKSGVSRLLKGERRLKYEEAQRAAHYLGVAPGGAAADIGGMAEEAAGYAAEAGAGAISDSAPLFRAETGENGLWRLDKSALIERRAPLPHFAGAKEIFGFYAPDNAMAPRYHAGEVVWVNPARPASTGKDALLITIHGDAAPAEIAFGVLESRSAHMMVLSQYGSGLRREFPVQDWRAVYVYGRD